MPHSVAVVCLAVVACTCALAANTDVEQDRGQIRGRVVRLDGSGIEGATVLLNETTTTVMTDRDGGFSFHGAVAGSYSITVTLGEHAITIRDVVVAAGQTTTLQEQVDWHLGFSETLTVAVTSRRSERLVEAPASVTKVTAGEIAQRASHGQLPKLVEFAPGAQLTQGGLYDFNLNARGFNSSLNRRVAVLVDGRNPAAAFFDAQEWAAAAFPLDDLESVELVRGPSAALYGANASSGVLNLVTKAPRSSRGGLVRASFGQLGTVNLDARWAGALGSNWFGKVTGGTRRSGDFVVSRRGHAEYSVPCGAGVTVNCLPQEAVVPPRIDDDDVQFAAARVDGYFRRGMVLSLEGGLSHVAGPVVQTGVGRTQITDVKRPWARVNLNLDHANVFMAYTGRLAPGQLSLASGTNSALTSHTFQFEGQTERSVAANRVLVVVGASATVERVDSFDETLQRQSLMFEPVRSNREALFGQLDWKVTRRLRLVLAGRGDFSSLHDFQFSPKSAVVYAPSPSHTARLTYSAAFQAPNYSELFLQADAAPPVNLAGLNAFCAPFAIDCGFGPTRVLALGNRDLALEKTHTFEAGYKGLILRRALVTIDYYRSRASSFLTDLLPQLGTPLGRINPNFGPWQAPPGLPEAVEAQIRAAAPAILSNNVDGSNILAAASYTNYGEVDTQGIDLAASYALAGGWRGALTYSWFDFSIRNPVPGLDRLVLPNSPGSTVGGSIGYSRGRFEGDFAVRWVDTFRWAVGPFQGDVEAYATADLTASYQLPRGLMVGLNIANLFDDQHWETFGGDILRRRALVTVGYGW
jgi:iron complex outermembrane receptor protein